MSQSWLRSLQEHLDRWLPLFKILQGILEESSQLGFCISAHFRCLASNTARIKWQLREGLRRNPSPNILFIKAWINTILMCKLYPTQKPQSFLLSEPGVVYWQLLCKSETSDKTLFRHRKTHLSLMQLCIRNYFAFLAASSLLLYVIFLGCYQQRDLTNHVIGQSHWLMRGTSQECLEFNCSCLYCFTYYWVFVPLKNYIKKSLITLCYL